MNVLRVKAGVIKNNLEIDDVIIDFTQQEVDTGISDSFIECLKLGGKQFDFIKTIDLTENNLDTSNLNKYIDINDYDLTIKH